MKNKLVTNQVVSVNRKKSTAKSANSVTPEFLKWLNSFTKKYAPALKELAKR